MHWFVIRHSVIRHFLLSLGISSFVISAPPALASGPKFGENDIMPYSVPRYLVAFHPKQIPHHFVDVLVIGGGIAGIRATMAIDPRLSALVVTKDRLQESNSSYAQGGIAGVIGPEDRFEDHIADTLNAGADLCDPAVVEMVVREAPAHIRQLIQWGTDFDQ